MRTLFDLAVPSIDGFRYEPDFITQPEEAALIEAVHNLPFGSVVFRGVEARRRVVQFGWDYEFGSRTATPAEPVPGFVVPLQHRAGDLIGMPPERLEEVLVTEYQPGAGIGWHRDAPPFGVVVGVSLASPCRLRLRPRAGVAGTPVSIDLELRSVYVFAGAVRTDWEHSIPATKQLRYSITFRTMRDVSRR